MEVLCASKEELRELMPRLGKGLEVGVGSRRLEIGRESFRNQGFEAFFIRKSFKHHGFEVVFR